MPPIACVVRVFAQAFSGSGFSQTERLKCFAIRQGKYKLIRVPGENGDIYRLFDLEADPQCKNDLKAAQPTVFERLRKELP